MMDFLDFKGFWWLPNNPEEKLAGICSYTVFEGGELEIIGNFSRLPDLKARESSLIILGSTLEGEITLYDCFLLKKKKRNKGIEVSRYFVNLIFSGIHFYFESDIKFKSISTHYSCMNEWVNIATFDSVHSEDGKEYLIYKRWEQLVKSPINENYSLSVGIGCDQTVDLFKKITVDRKVFLTIESATDKHYKDYREVMNHVRNFLTLGITKPVFPLVMNGWIVKDEQLSVIQILGKLAIPKDKFAASQISWQEMFFTFRDISEKFDFFVKNWFDKMEDLETVYELYCGILENPDSYYPQQEFLSLIQALESYCQKNLNPDIKKFERDKTKHQEMVDLIVEKAPTEYVGWLINKLNNSNNTSLSVKLMSLLKSTSFLEIIKHLKKSESAFKIFLDGKTRDEFVNKIVKIRNALSHGSGYDEDMYGKDFRFCIQRLKVIVEILLLKELGFEKEDIRILILRSQIGSRIL